MKSAKQKYRSAQRALVLERANQTCEGCGQFVEEPQCAHLFGRGNIINDQYASDALMCVGLCVTCHQSIDSNRNVELRDRLRAIAVVRFAATYNLEINPSPQPVDIARDLERQLEGRRYA